MHLAKQRSVDISHDPARRAVLATDASSIAVAAILTHWQLDDESPQHPVAYEC